MRYKNRPRCLTCPAIFARLVILHSTNVGTKFLMRTRFLYRGFTGTDFLEKRNKICFLRLRIEMDDCTNVDGYWDSNRVVPVTTFRF